jgi:hypothetical protein
VRRDTDTLHEHVVRVGKCLGFQSTREASVRVGSGDGVGYAPRLDILWTQRLSSAQLGAIQRVGARVPVRGEADLPVAAWEVEGSDASTKGMQADIANMRVCGAPFGFLAVNGSTKDNLYKRACHLARTQRHYFGDQSIVPIDTNWLSHLGELTLSSEIPPRKVRMARGGGGECERTSVVRRELQNIGERAGFCVSASFVSAVTANMAPTRSQIDLVWTLPMPKGLREFVAGIREFNVDLAVQGLIVPERYDQIVVVAFEIENDSKKHGYGGLLNLASHGMAGVFVAGNAPAFAAARAAHATYGGTFPLSRVSICEEFVQ